MKVLISTDIEGVAGVFHSEQGRPGNGEYERARRWMTAEANAAVAGAFEAGATEVCVNDSHGGFRNLLADEIDPRATLLMGKPRVLSMAAGVEGRPDALCLVGYHSRAQGRGILAHTINSFAFARIWVNGEEIGEAGLYGALAGEYGVPVVMASGDDAFIDEHRPLFPHAAFVQTKRATGQNSGVSLSPAKACTAIREGVITGLQARARCKPLLLKVPATVRVQTQTPALADLFCIWPTLQRLAGDELGFEAPSAEAAVRMLNGLSAMSAMLR